MSFDLTGSLYNRAVQTQKAAILTGTNADAKSKKYTLSYTNAYNKTQEAPDRPTLVPPTNKLNIIA